MKVKITALLLVCLILLCGCFDSYLPEQNEIEKQFLQNKVAYQKAAEAAFSYEGEHYFSTTQLSRPENWEGGEGVYIGDMEQNVNLIENDALYKIFTNCNVYSMHTSVTSLMKVCEFNCAGSGSVYSGVYYTSANEPLCLMDFSVQLAENGEGFLAELGDWGYYYTEKIEDGFFYYEARR